MSTGLRERIQSIQRAIRSKDDEDKARSLATRYRDLSAQLSAVKDELEALRAKSRQLAAEGYRDPTPELAPLIKSLEAEREHLDSVLEFNTSQFDAMWRARSAEWSNNHQILISEVESRYAGAGLTEQVLRTLRPHFPDAIDDLEARQRDRESLRAQKSKPADYLEQLKALHEADLRSLEALAGKGASSEWKAALQLLVSASGIPWSELQGSPLMEWIEHHELIDFCRVRLR
jgi:DNA repair exonuclease SbcCD ATPase subunit